jgi:putative SOS response-associated peptidase YedK
VQDITSWKGIESGATGENRRFDAAVSAGNGARFRGVTARFSNASMMCGRYGLTRSPGKLAARLGARRRFADPFEPRYNIAPTQPVLAITNAQERPVVALRWGLVPYWAESASGMKLTTFNARIETIATAPSYRDSTRLRRCVILADGFYEWRRSENGVKTPFWIHRVDEEPFAFAGLWDRWRARRPTEEDVESCTIVTGPANEFMAPIHSRMPIVLSDARAAAWLAPEPLAPSDALDVLIPDEAAPAWEMYAVSPRVGNVRNDDARLTQPAFASDHSLRIF